MSLNDHEQRILSEIERQFYAEDPDLAYTARNIDRIGRFGVRLPLSGVVAGIVLMVVSFSEHRFLAVAGFALMVVSATALVHGMRSRGGLLDIPADGDETDRRSPSGRRRRRR